MNTRYLLTLALTPLILYLCGTTQEAHAALSIVVQDQASCEAAPLNGTWEETGGPPICHITDLKLNSGDSFTLDNSIYDNIHMTISGMVSNAGTITLDGLTRVFQTINNNGTINVNSQFGSEGTINNNSGGTINVTVDFVSEGTINNAYGATINNYANILSGGATATINNFGAINNTAIFDNYATLNNHQTGTVYNYNQMNNHGTVNNLGAISNSGTFSEMCPSTFNGNPVTGNPAQVSVCDTTSTSMSFSSVNSYGLFYIMANVTDTVNPANTPTGIVMFSSNYTGDTECNLVAGSDGSSHCSVPYSAPTTTGSYTITATYPGDSTHRASSTSGTLTVP